MNEVLLIAGIVLGFAIVFPLLWSAVCVLISWIGGWSALARRYRHEGPAAPGARLVSAMLGVASYRGTLWISGDDQALYLEVMVLFRPGHPRLRIPWSDVQASTVSAGLFGGLTNVRIGQIATLRLSGSTWEAVRPAGRASP